MYSLQDILYNHLKDFVNSFGSILRSAPYSLDFLKTFSSFIPINFEANIIINDLDEKYYFRITLEDHYIRKENYDFCRLFLSGNSRTWLNIFLGKETLMGAFNAGKITMNNIKEMYILRMAFLSNILFNFAMKKQRIIRAGKYLKFPLFSRRIITVILIIILKIGEYLPKSSLERIIKKFSKFLEEE
ncbi:MAG: hypothetical protein ACP6IY_04410 [Promethearchaeia archaeon]